MLKKSNDDCLNIRKGFGYRCPNCGYTWDTYTKLYGRGNTQKVYCKECHIDFPAEKTEYTSYSIWELRSRVTAKEDMIELLENALRKIKESKMQVGDKVIVKRKDELTEEYADFIEFYSNGEMEIVVGEDTICDTMFDLCGKEVTIENVIEYENYSVYNLKEDKEKWNFTDGMLKEIK